MWTSAFKFGIILVQTHGYSYFRTTCTFNQLQRVQLDRLGLLSWMQQINRFPKLGSSWSADVQKEHEGTTKCGQMPKREGFQNGDSRKTIEILMTSSAANLFILYNPSLLK